MAREPARYQEKTRPERELGRVPLREVRREEHEERRFHATGEVARREQQVKGRWVEAPGPNEDRVFSDEKYGFFGVADGMGGYAHGERASDVVKNIFLQAIPPALERVFELTPEVTSKYSKGGEPVDPVLRKLRSFIEDELGIPAHRFADAAAAESALLGALMVAHSRIKKEAPDGGTTVSALATYETSDGALRGKLVNRGDSRTYRFRDGKLEQLTKDDSLVQLLFDRGFIEDDEDVEAELSPKALAFIQDIKVGAYGKGTKVKDIRPIVTAGVGYESEKAVANTKISDVELKRGDVVISLTDGMENLTRERLRVIVDQYRTAHVEVIAAKIIEAAKEVARSNDPRAKQDDMGVVVASIEGVPGSLQEALERHYRTLARTYSEPLTSDRAWDQMLSDQIFEFTGIRNQLEFAMESYPNHEKLKALHDHIMSILRFLGERQATLRKGKWSPPPGEEEELRLGDDARSAA